MTDGPQTRTVEVPPERLSGWLARFADRHGSPTAGLSEDGARLALRCPDGATASIGIPFPPLDPASDLVEHVSRPRTVGVLLVRRGGYGVGVFRGRELIESKVGSGYVQGRTKAGGWSQQRFARRRANQARESYREAADVAARIILPRVGDIEAIVTGGDKAGISEVLADARLERLRRLVSTRVLSVPDPRLAVLAATPDQFLSVRIELNALA
jgi:Actinobacteria/chloroflexi VLRF1 release factor